MHSKYFTADKGCSVYLRKNVFKGLFEEDVDEKLYLVLSVSEIALRQFHPLNPIAEILLRNRDDYNNLIANWPKFYGGQEISREDRVRLSEILSSYFSFSFGKLQGKIRSAQSEKLGGGLICEMMENTIYLEIHRESREIFSEILGISPEEITQAVSDFLLSKIVISLEQPNKIVENFFIRTKDRRTLKMEFDDQQNYLERIEFLAEMDRRYAK